MNDPSFLGWRTIRLPWTWRVLDEDPLNILAEWIYAGLSQSTDLVRRATKACFCGRGSRMLERTWLLSNEGLVFSNNSPNGRLKTQRGQPRVEIRVVWLPTSFANIDIMI